MFRNFFNVLLISALLVLLFNNSFFKHFHRLADGTIIEHAHPFSEQKKNDGTTPSHEHNTADIIILDSFFQISKIIIAAILILFYLLIALGSICFKNAVSSFSSDIQFYKSLRAPPA
jgi:hypothetical protein